MSKLREAAEAVMRAWEAGKSLDDLEAAAEALRAALAEDRLADPDVRADVRAQVETLTVEELRCAVVLQRLEIDQLRKRMLAAFAENTAAVLAEREACAAIAFLGDTTDAIYKCIRARGKK